jgi:tetratricopeptide (TPR) repeat protein
MDKDGSLGLRTAPDHLLNEARQRTRGFPRALEALVAILRSDRDTTLPDILRELREWEQRQSDDPLSEQVEHVVQKLVGDAFNRLDALARQVMQALAIYGRPVPAVAIDYLLQPFTSGIDSAPVLKRLVSMHFARGDGGRYYLHPVDRAYALSLMPKNDSLLETQPKDKQDKKALLGRIQELYGRVKEEEDSPPFTQIAMLRRGAAYFRRTRKPRAEWNALVDLEPQLAEIDLRYIAEDYDTAAEVLSEIDFDYLLLWGYAHLLIEYHERLRGKISYPSLQLNNLNTLALSYNRVGRTYDAISCYQKALVIAKENRKNRWEGILRGNLGLAYNNIGDIQQAIDFSQQALVIAQETEDSQNEQIWLGNLGLAYSSRGDLWKAIEYHKQALAIAQKLGVRRSEGIHLANPGQVYSDLGEIWHAVDYYQHALAIQQEIGDRRSQSTTLDELGCLYITQEEWEEASILINEAIQGADEIGFAQGQNSARCSLAELSLFTNDLPLARTAIEVALQYDTLGNDYSGQALLGLICLRQGDHAVARDAFAAALEEADTMLSLSARNYNALYTKGLALAGLALCTFDNTIPEAVTAYCAARSILVAPGVIARELRFFDALAIMDREEKLIEIRRALSGE